MFQLWGSQAPWLLQGMSTDNRLWTTCQLGGLVETYSSMGQHRARALTFSHIREQLEFVTFEHAFRPPLLPRRLAVRWRHGRCMQTRSRALAGWQCSALLHGHPAMSVPGRADAQNVGAVCHMRVTQAGSCNANERFSKIPPHQRENALVVHIPSSRPRKVLLSL